jgi:hypothetical protein
MRTDAERKEETERKEAERKEVERKEDYYEKKIKKGKVTFGVWGLIIGAIIAMIIGFKWGGWTLSSTTEQMTEDAVSESQLASQAAICVAQFIKDPKYNERLQELQESGTDRWDRAKYIEKGGWDKMPGRKEATNGVARACTDGLIALIKK